MLALFGEGWEAVSVSLFFFFGGGGTWGGGGGKQHFLVFTGNHEDTIAILRVLRIRTHVARFGFMSNHFLRWFPIEIHTATIGHVQLA